MSTFDQVTTHINKLDQLASDALSNDLKENAFVLARMTALGVVLLPGFTAMIVGDMWMANNRVHNQLAQIKGHYQWLTRSSQSAEQLASAVAQWSQIGHQQSSVVSEIAAGQGRMLNEHDWSGLSQSKHVQEVREKREKEAAFAESIACIIDGCAQAQALTTWIMTRASTDVGLAAALATSPASTPPNAASWRMRNWRLRAVEGHFSTLRLALSNLEAKNEWRARETSIAKVFNTHAAVLAELQRQFLGGGPFMMYAV